MSARGGKIVAALGALLLCYAVSVGALLGANGVRAAEGMDDILYLPNEKLLTHFTGGLHTVVADLLWLHCIQYTALEHRGQRHFTWLEHMSFTTVRLDPYFVDVYRCGAIFLAALRADAEASLRLSRQGMLLNPTAWQLPYEAAMNYLLNKSDEPNSRYYAAQYLSISAASGSAPGGVVNLAGKLQGEFNLLEVEQDMWKEMLSNEDAFMREVAERKLGEIHLREVCRILNERLAQYKEHTGQSARSIEELKTHGLIKSAPEDPLGGEFFIDPDGVARSTTLLDDEVIRGQNQLYNAIDEYQQAHNRYPPTLDALVDSGQLEALPAHPYPDRTWQYNPETGVVE